MFCLAEDFSIHEIKETGLYFEKISNVHFSEQQWTLLTYLNMSYYLKQQTAIDALIIKIDEVCKKSTEITCKQIYYTIKQRIPVIKNSFSNFQYLIGHHVRNKRGWFNLIGKGLKTIFGTLDSEDADYYDDAIKSLEQNQKDSLRILQDQLTIFSDTFHDFNTTANNIKRMQKGFNDIILKINTENSKFINEINNYGKSQYEEQLIDYINTLVTDIEIELNKITNVVMFTKIGQIHPLIIPPKKLITELIDSKQSLPNELIYPVDLKLENIYLIYKISEIICYLEEEKLIFVIKVPLTTREKFEVYNVLPIPIQKFYNTIMIKPKRKLLIISMSKTKATLLNELENCKGLGIEKICKQVTMSNPFNNEKCETELFIRNKIIDECDKRIIDQDIEVFHKLETSNSWLYTLTQPVVVNINCGSMDNIKIQGTGIITINNNKCKLSTIDQIMIPELFLKDTSENKISQANLFDNDCCTDENLKYSIALQPISKIDLVDFNLMDLSNAAHKIYESKGRISDLLSRPNPVRHFSYVTYVTSIISLVVFSYVLYRCCGSKGSLIFKFCFLNNWFRKRNVQTAPRVQYNVPNDSLQIQSMPMRSTSSEGVLQTIDAPKRRDSAEPTYRFD